MEENNQPQFSIVTMPSSRPAHYYLRYLDSCVFMDFNRYGTEQIQLVRISFDGYGCCNVPNAIPMDLVDAQAFKGMMNTGMLDQALLLNIVKRTIADHRAQPWEKTLVKYGLLKHHGLTAGIAGQAFVFPFYFHFLLFLL